MVGDPNARRRHRSLSKGRLEAYSDGVFSIAATLLILDVAVHPPGTPLEQVLRAWPAYVGYLVSFLTIGAAWIAHAALTDRLKRTDAIFLRLNLLVLLAVVFLPFPTMLLSEGLGKDEAERVAATLYGMTLMAIRLTGTALDAYARREHLYAADQDKADEDELQGFRKKSLMVLIGYMATILVGLALPEVAVACYFALALFLVVPFREVRQLLFHRPRRP